MSVHIPSDTSSDGSPAPVDGKTTTADGAPQQLVQLDFEDISCLPWWKLILFNSAYRQRLREFATRIYRRELRTLEVNPHLLSSAEGMVGTTVMAQYVCVGPNSSISTHHPRAVIRQSALRSVRQSLLGNMPPVASVAERQQQINSVDNFLCQKRRDSLLTSRREKRCNLYDVLKSRRPLANLFDGVTVSPMDVGNSNASGEAGGESAPMPQPPVYTLLNRTASSRASARCAEGKKFEDDLDDAPTPPSRPGMSEPVRPPVSSSRGGRVPSEKKDGAALLAASIPPEAMDDDFVLHGAEADARLLDAALVSIDGTQNLYGLSHDWDQPLPPSGFIRLQPDPRYAMWPPDDIRENDRCRLEAERRRQRVERRRRRVNERNKKLVYMHKFGLKVRPGHFDGSDEDDEEIIGHNLLPFRAPRAPLPDGPLNINIYKVIPKPAAPTGKGAARSGTQTEVTPTTTTHATATPVGVAGSATAHNRRQLVGTYRQSLLLIHFKVYCRALHDEMQLRPSMNENDLKNEDLSALMTRTDAEHLLRDVPDIPTPVLRVQAAAPPLKDPRARHTPDTTQIHPARCWVGLSAVPPSDLTAPATHVWRYLHRVSFLARQALRDIFSVLRLERDKTLRKDGFIDFVLDLLNLYFPTHLAQQHVDIAEEEWIYRGTTEQMTFDTFFEKFFSFPFIFYRNLDAVTEVDYVEFWTLTRVCLYETRETTPALLPFACFDFERQRLMKGTCTCSHPAPSKVEAVKTPPKLLLQVEKDGSTLLVGGATLVRAEESDVQSNPELHAMLARGEEVMASRNVPRELYAKAVADDLHQRQGEEFMGHPVAGAFHSVEVSSDEDMSSVSDATPPWKSEAQIREKPRGRKNRIRTSPPPKKRAPLRRLSLLTALHDFGPQQVARMYAGAYQHCEDYELFVEAAATMERDSFVRRQPPCRREAMAFARAARNLKRRKDSAARAQKLVDKESAAAAAEMREQRRSSVISSSDSGGSSGGGRQRTVSPCPRRGAAVPGESRRTQPEGGAAEGTGEEPLHRQLSRHTRLAQRAEARREHFEQMEVERNRLALLSLSTRYQERHRRLQAQHDRVYTKIESVESSWHLHAEDTYQPPTARGDVEDTIIDYLQGVADEVFEGRVSLRERFLIHETFRKERYRQNNARLPHHLSATNASAVAASSSERDYGSPREGHLPVVLPPSQDTQSPPTITEQFLADMQPQPALFDATHDYFAVTLGVASDSGVTAAGAGRPPLHSFAGGLYPLKSTAGVDPKLLTIASAVRCRLLMGLDECKTPTVQGMSRSLMASSVTERPPSATRGPHGARGYHSSPLMNPLGRTIHRHGHSQGGVVAFSGSGTGDLVPGGPVVHLLPHAQHLDNLSGTQLASITRSRTALSGVVSNPCASANASIADEEGPAPRQDVIAHASGTFTDRSPCFLSSDRRYGGRHPVKGVDAPMEDPLSHSSPRVLSYVMQPRRICYAGRQSTGIADGIATAPRVRADNGGVSGDNRHPFPPSARATVVVMGDTDQHTGAALDRNLSTRLQSQRLRQRRYEEVSCQKEHLRRLAAKVPVPPPPRRVTDKASVPLVGSRTATAAHGGPPPPVLGLSNPSRGYRVFDTTKFTAIAGVTYIPRKKDPRSGSNRLTHGAASTDAM